MSLAVCRIVLVGTQLSLLLWKDVYNLRQRVEISRLPDSWYDPLPLLRLLTLDSSSPPGDGFVFAVHYAALLAGFLALIGLKTNFALVVFAASNVFLQAVSYSFGDFHHPEAIMFFALGSLALSPAGAVLSVDDWLSRGRAGTVDLLARQSAFARWPLLLTQWLLALAYFDAALSKMYMAGFDWMNGYTLQYYLSYIGLDRDSEFAIWLSQIHWLNVLLAWATIAFEGGFILVLVFRRLAWILLPAGLGIHLGMCVTHIACFYQFMAAYCVFVDWEWVLRKLRGSAG